MPSTAPATKKRPAAQAAAVMLPHSSRAVTLSTLQIMTIGEMAASEARRLRDTFGDRLNEFPVSMQCLQQLEELKGLMAATLAS